MLLELQTIPTPSTLSYGGRVGQRHGVGITEIVKSRCSTHSDAWAEAPCGLQLAAIALAFNRLRPYLLDLSRYPR